MSRLQRIESSAATGKAKDLLDAVKQKMGATPNIFTAFANSPAALEGYLALNNALTGGVLDTKLREKLSLVVAGYNGCGYCASAHNFLGKKAGIPQEELQKNLQGKSSENKDQGALAFAIELLKNRGKISDSTLANIRRLGFSDEEIVEILAHVAMNVFTNYFNEAFQTEIDFPEVKL